MSSKEYHHNWYMEHREKFLKDAKVYRDGLDREELRKRWRESGKRYREKGGEKLKAYRLMKHKEWKKNNRERYLSVRRKHAHELSRRQRELIQREKMRPCMDCRVQYNPWVMHFDHRDPATKRFCVGNTTLRCSKTIMEEIKKCDVVCSNCHAERTHKRYIDIHPVSA